MSEETTEEILDGRPTWDNPFVYQTIRETIREYNLKGERVVALCFDCMEVPRSPSSVGGQRCEPCDGKRTRRMNAAAAASGFVAPG